MIVTLLFYYSFLFHFYIFCLDQPGIGGTRRRLTYVLNSCILRSPWILGGFILHLEIISNVELQVTRFLIGSL